MLIDLIYGVLIVVAIFKGLRRGLIVALFSIAAFIVGIAAAMKLSAVVAGYLDNTTNVSARWLPVISFLLVLVIVVIIIRLIARMLESAAQATGLGIINKVGGVLLYLVIYTFVFSILLFYAVNTRLIAQEGIDKSNTYSFIAPWGPYIIEKLGVIIPVFKDLFSQLSTYFDRLIK